jgi:hypothetical protein
MKHTQLPWMICIGDMIKSANTETLGARVADCDTSAMSDKPYLATEPDKANAAFIVRACNSHYELLAALELCTRYLADLSGADWIQGNDSGSVDMRQRAVNLQKLAFSECTKAKG